MSAGRDRLHALLRLRRDAELRALVALAGVHASRRAITGEIERTSELIERSRHQMRDALTGAVDAEALRLGAHGAILHEFRRRRAVAALAETGPALLRAQRDASDAAARRKGVELLQRRRREAALRRIQRAEQAALDEIAARHAGGWA